ncbi:MAG: hypothetical protein RL264_3019 [Bacteroidota bacterium]|jgi:transposase-like protein
MIKNGKQVRHLRRFSEDFKRKIVTEHESGQNTIVELEKIYDMRNSVLYRWI